MAFFLNIKAIVNENAAKMTAWHDFLVRRRIVRFVLDIDQHVNCNGRNCIEVVCIDYVKCSC